MGTKWQCPYCGEVYPENRPCCSEVHCFEFDEEKQCPACGSGDTGDARFTDANGETTFLICHECGEEWNFS